MSIQDKCFAYSLVPPNIPEYETLEFQVILNTRVGGKIWSKERHYGFTVTCPCHVAA